LATEKQIAANRANAKRSTGPKTAAGKQKSSRNAFRHGLSRPGQPDTFAVEKIITVIGALTGAPATEVQQNAAQELACAQLELGRIQAIRAEQWEKTADPGEDLHFNDKDLKRLASLDRYDREALAKRRKAAKNLRVEW
jgi:hypothetical protein